MILLNTKRTNYISIENSLKVQLINELAQYAARHQDTTFYHYPLYVKILSLESNQPFSFIISRSGEGKINGFMALLETRGINLGPRSSVSCKRLASLPRTSFSGPVADSEEITCAILDAAKELCDAKKNYLLQIKTKFNLHDLDPDFKTIKWRDTYIIDLSQSCEKLNMMKKTRHDISRCIKKAQEYNILFKQSDSVADLKNWYRLYLNVMRFHRYHARSFRFFKLCWDILKPAGLVDFNIAVELNNNSDEILMGTFNFKFNNYFINNFGAGLFKKANLLAGDFLTYNEIIKTKELGFKYLDLGESPVNHNKLIYYKLKWGAFPQQIYHNYYGKKSGSINNYLDFYGDDSLSTKIWRKVPLKITELAGTIINSRL